MTDVGLSVPHGPDLFSSDDAIDFINLQDCSLPDIQLGLPNAQPSPPNIQQALGTAIPEPRESLVNYFEQGSFNLASGHPAAEQSSSATESGSPLHMAVLRGSGKIVQLLLKHGADCNAKDHQGRTPLIHAVFEEKEDVVDMLLSHGAEVQVMDNYQRSPLHWSVLKRRDRLLSILIKHCEQNLGIINAHDCEGRTALHIAISLGRDVAVQILLEAGADVQAPTKSLAPGKGLLA